MLKEVVPSAKRIAIVYNLNEPASVNELRKMQDATRTLGIDLQSVKAPDAEGLDQAFQNALAGGAQGPFSPSRSPIAFELPNSRRSIARLECMAGASSPRPAD